MAYGYRLLRGKGSATGYVRGNGETLQLQGKGLAPGMQYTAYALDAGTARPLATGKADRGGTLRLTLAGAGTLFVALGQTVTLWEDADDPALHFWQAQAALTAQRGAVSVAAKTSAEKAPAESERPPQIEAPSGDAEQPVQTTSQPQATRETLPETRTMPPEINASPAERETAVQEAAEPAEREIVLRPESAAPPVDGLPALVWPEAAAHLKAYFETQAPFAPFDAPGWRFVRVPSPLRGVPYCAVGVHAQDARVTQVAYAVPGSPQQAPAALPGYRYQVGRTGQGYWTLWRTV